MMVPKIGVKMILEFQHQRYFGNRFYPQNDDAKLLCALMQRKSLTADQIQYCRRGGWHVKISDEKEVKNDP